MKMAPGLAGAGCMWDDVQLTAGATLSAEDGVNAPGAPPSPRYRCTARTAGESWSVAVASCSAEVDPHDPVNPHPFS